MTRVIKLIACSCLILILLNLSTIPNLILFFYEIASGMRLDNTYRINALLTSAIIILLIISKSCFSAKVNSNEEQQQIKKRQFEAQKKNIEEKPLINKKIDFLIHCLTIIGAYFCVLTSIIALCFEQFDPNRNVHHLLYRIALDVNMFIFIICSVFSVSYVAVARYYTNIKELENIKVDECRNSIEEKKP